MRVSVFWETSRTVHSLSPKVKVLSKESLVMSMIVMAVAAMTAVNGYCLLRARHRSTCFTSINSPTTMTLQDGIVIPILHLRRRKP